ncbi:MAG: alcohol dehydrogenase catalytic domain-containing protein [Paenibacillaceae bacterium]|nr:alcohol dehydrogenase catalytic domain-containing protein [Paenibacillaceae bacterium]
MNDNKMNAIVFEAPGQLAYRQVERPACGPDEVIVRIRRIGICGTDVEMFHGHIHKAKFPIIPGHEWAGEIVELGSEASGYRIGDRVVGETTISCGRCRRCRSGAYNMCERLSENGIFGKNGAACEYMAFPVHGMHRFDSRLSYDQACLIEPSAVAFRGLEKLGLSQQDTLAVIGPGTIGLLTVAAAKHRGVRKVVLVGFQESRLQLGLKLGADEIIDLSRQSYAERALEATNGELFSAVVEASGNAEACEQLFSIVGPGSKVLLLGTYGEKLPRIDANKIVDNDMVIHGSLSSPGVWDTVVDWMESTALPVTDLITHHFALSEYEAALRLIEKRDPAVLKVMLEP